MEIKKVTVTLRILLIVYISIVFYFTIICREPSDEYMLELQPFKTIIGLLNFDYDSHGRYILREVLLNIALLMPVGFLFGLSSTLLRVNATPMTGVRFREAIFLGFLTSLTIEVLQLITKTGTFEVDDLIYNTFGCVIGYLICSDNLLGVLLRRGTRQKTK